MKICPGCEEEFIDSMSTCPSCEETLLSELEALKQPQRNAFLSKEEFLKSETFPFMQGTLTNCREIEKILAGQEIMSAVYPVNLGPSDNAAALGSSDAVKYMLLVRKQDGERCQRLLEGRFLDQVAKEGQGALVQGFVNLSDQEICCPACQEKGELKDGECQHCGLYLGENTP